MLNSYKSDYSVLPEHIAIIMDGNGRWAEGKGLPRVDGHRRGAEVINDVVKHCQKIKIKHLTLFAFSAENWLRPINEVK